MLAELAARPRPAPWTPPPAGYHEPRQQLVQRDALLDVQGQVRNQLHALKQHPVVVASVRDRLAALPETLATQMREVEREVAEALRQDETWAVSASVLVSIPGSGPITAAWLLVATLKFTACEDAEAATASAGLTPQPDRSGTSVRKREAIGRTGNARPRTALSMAALSACRHNPVIRPFYEQPRAAGKPVKVAR